MDALTTEIRDWLEQGAHVRVDGVRLYYRVAGQQRAELPWMVCFHGFPTSSWDWHAVLPALARQRRVLLFDFPGFVHNIIAGNNAGSAGNALILQTVTDIDAGVAAATRCG